MSLASVLARGRNAAERRMVDECVIRRAGVTEPVYSGRCEIKQSSDEGGEAQDEADAYALNLRLGLKLPIRAVGLELGDEAELTVSSRDPELVGRFLRIQGLAFESNATCRRLFVVERTSPVYLRGGDERAWTT
ncbi:DUF6093 family protein [Micromonospora tarensis]|uniref:PilZ domain-containing protein n=1 Tax=Micromonospora tarensis TaxID=2806100 RepID=A0ABS1YCK2_9ACTN|nr:DUF6093 family protein [Micromonospora tarensis]MBM0275098.1 hypothetical protein [Micromonospora tarensis]